MLPDDKPARKPRRLGLFLPFMLVVMAAAAWSAGWFYMKSQVERRMDAVAATATTGAGVKMAWKSRQVSGFPFRLDVTLTDVKLADPSGWAVSIPELHSEAFPYAPDHWVFVAPKGVVLHRPETGLPADAALRRSITKVMAGAPAAAAVPMQGGDVTITGEVIRASVVMEKGAPFPRVSLEGARLNFAAAPGAEPFWIQSADHLEFHFRPGPNDQGALLLRLDGARARLSGLVARIAQDKPIQLIWASTFSHASALKGSNWPEAAKAWRAAGGRLTIDPTTQVTGGDAVFGVKSGDIGIDADGRVTGRIEAELKEAPRALAAMGQQGEVDPTVATAAAVAAVAGQNEHQVFAAPILFGDGKTRLGPFELGDAPRAY